jgi:predicted DNA-binding transcriptional regulator YafY
LPGNAPAIELLARLLDALLVLDAEKSCSIGELAHRVGLQPRRMRELLSSFMVAGSEVLGPEAPFNIVFGTSTGPLDPDEELDDEQARADHVYRASGVRSEQISLVDDVGRAPITVDQVAAAVLAGGALMESGALEQRHRDAVGALIDKLASAMNMTLREPVDPVAQKLRAAAHARQRVRFRYREPGGGAGVDETLTVEPYDVRRRRDRLVLDAGPDPVEVYRIYDVASMSDVETVGEPDAFEPPELPPREQRERALDVVLRVPADSPAFVRLRDGWGGAVVATRGSEVDVRITVDRPASGRVAILLLRLGPACSLVSPESMQSTVQRVARRLVDAH